MSDTRRLVLAVPFGNTPAEFIKKRERITCRDVCVYAKLRANKPDDENVRAGEHMQISRSIYVVIYLKII